jgi:hypothetical protein
MLQSVRKSCRVDQSKYRCFESIITIEMTQPQKLLVEDWKFYKTSLRLSVFLIINIAHH